jgi:ankyrin repeat protein
METSISPPGTSKQSGVRKPSPGSSLKDLCLVSKQGSIAEVESALALLKKSGGNIDGRNAFGLSALHLATWRNHLPIVRRLLEAGADPDARVCTIPCSELLVFTFALNIILFFDPSNSLSCIKLLQTENKF